MDLKGRCQLCCTAADYIYAAYVILWLPHYICFLSMKTCPNDDLSLYS